MIITTYKKNVIMKINNLDSSNNIIKFLKNNTKYSRLPINRPII